MTVTGWREPAPQGRHARADSPVHKAVTPVEAARVDKVDAFFEVLFAREESNREGSAGGQVSQELSPPHLQTARDTQPWVLSAASMFHYWERGQAP